MWSGVNFLSCPSIRCKGLFFPQKVWYWPSVICCIVGGNTEGNWWWKVRWVKGAITLRRDFTKVLSATIRREARDGTYAIECAFIINNHSRYNLYNNIYIYLSYDMHEHRWSFKNGRPYYNYFFHRESHSDCISASLQVFFFFCFHYYYDPSIYGHLCRLSRSQANLINI